MVCLEYSMSHKDIKTHHATHIYTFFFIFFFFFLLLLFFFFFFFFDDIAVHCRPSTS
jgi:hypothetical protein